MERDKAFYLPELDGLRFFAFLAVFAFHCGILISGLRFDTNPWLVGSRAILNAGRYGVDLFFTLSAFLITRLLLREIDACGNLNIGAFYIRRILRIWPLYFGFLGLLLVSGAGLPRLFYESSALFVGNFYLSPFAATTAAIIIWSMSVEEQFYLLWPMVVRRLHTRRQLLSVGAALWIAAMIGRCELVGRVDDLSLWFNSLSHLDSIAGGVVLAVLGIRRLRLGGPLAGAGVCIWLFSSWLNHSATTHICTLIAYALVAPGSLLLVAGAVGSAGLLQARPIIYLGRISFGLYIFHTMMLFACLKVLGHIASWWLIPPAALAMTIIVASVSYRWFETPFLQLKVRFQRARSGKIEEPIVVCII
jgi:peptidoglycan/LPS O-acetylase OafA/YrhL